MTARQASTVCLLRDGATGVEVLMVRRPLAARFMAGTWVFPGGALDESDGSGLARSAVTSDDETELPWRAAALREVVEEVGIWVTDAGPRTDLGRRTGTEVYEASLAAGFRLDGDRLGYLANWITPTPLPVRFDTRFFVAAVDPETQGEVDGSELIDLEWTDPAAAVGREARGAWAVAFPTLRTLEALSRFTTAAAAVEDTRSRDVVPPVRPRLVVEEAAVRLLLPDDPEYADAGRHENDPDLLIRLVEVARRGGVVPAELRRA